MASLWEEFKSDARRLAMTSVHKAIGAVAIVLDLIASGSLVAGLGVPLAWILGVHLIFALAFAVVLAWLWPVYGAMASRRDDAVADTAHLQKELNNARKVASRTAAPSRLALLENTDRHGVAFDLRNLKPTEHITVASVSHPEAARLADFVAKMLGEVGWDSVRLEPYLIPSAPEGIELHARGDSDKGMKRLAGCLNGAGLSGVHVEENGYGADIVVGFPPQ